MPFQLHVIFLENCHTNCQGCKKCLLFTSRSICIGLSHCQKPLVIKTVLLHSERITQRHNSGTEYGLDRLKKKQQISIQFKQQTTTGRLAIYVVHKGMSKKELQKIIAKTPQKI